MIYHLRLFFEYGLPHTPLWPGPPGNPISTAPTAPRPKEQWKLFKQQADTVLEMLRRELGDGWEVVDLRETS